MKTYMIQKGDTLSSIAKKFLGSASRYPEIMKANCMQDTLIIAGETIVIPTYDQKPETKNYSEIGKQLVKCLKEIESLESVKQLEKMLEG